MKLRKPTSKTFAAASPKRLSRRAQRLSVLCLIVAAAAIVVISSVGAKGGDDYEVRAIFVNSAGITNGADVRVAGANVGTIDGIYAGKDGLASVILKITDPAFQTFYEDAKCRIRLQSLIGEKFVDCDPGTPTKPELKVDPADDERVILPHQQTSSPVDQDELLNAMREPQRERFRVILNELGVTLTGRGQDLQDILNRFDPTFKEINDILKILAKQNKNLVTLAEDGDRSLKALAENRDHIVGLFKNADEAARATNAKQAELAETLARLPAFLRELEETAPVLENFANQAAPVAASTRAASSDLSEFVTGTNEFVDAANPALKRFGDTADVFRAQVPALQPIAETLKGIGDNRKSVTNLKNILTSFEKQGGYANLGALATGLVAAGNARDSFGHFMRSMMVIGAICFDYQYSRNGGCASDFAEGSGSNVDPPSKTSKGTIASKSSTMGSDVAALDYLLGGE